MSKEKKTNGKTYGGYTLDEIDVFIKASEDTEESFDIVASGGDSATSCMVIKDLVAEMRLLAKRLAKAKSNLKG